MAKKQKMVENYDPEKEKARQRVLNFKATNKECSFGDALEWQIKEREGKHKMSVINAVRNKLLALALAVIKRNSPFIKEYSFSFA